MVWNAITYQGYQGWKGQRDGVELTIVPAVGGKVVSLVNTLSGREWLWGAGFPLHHGGYGSTYAEADGSGWDEMFPTIDACSYPAEPWQGERVPDHGELWTQSWHADALSETLVLTARGVRFPYVLEKRVSFPAPGNVRFDYRLENESERVFSFLWAAHPLFNIRPGTQILVPPSIGRIVISQSQNDRLGQRGDKVSWPVVGDIRLDEMGQPDSTISEKFYFDEFGAEGWLALADPETEEYLTMRFPTEQVPYAAVWMNCGGYRREYNLALEPATGFLDSLEHAYSKKQVTLLEPGATYEWYLEVDFSHPTEASDHAR